MELQRELGELRGAGLEIVGISYDSVETLRGFAAERELGFLLLSDAGSATIGAYGVLNPEATGRTAGIPHPTVFLLDSEGTIRAKLRHPGYKQRPAPRDLIEAARAFD